MRTFAVYMAASFLLVLTWVASRVFRQKTESRRTIKDDLNLIFCGRGGKAMRKIAVCLAAVFLLVLIIFVSFMTKVKVNSPKPIKRNIIKNPTGYNPCAHSQFIPHDMRHRHILTIFTSFKNDFSKFTTYNNTLHNWASFMPQVQPVLFSGNNTDQLEEIARRLGWIVLDSPRTNKYGTPFLKDMFLKVNKTVGSFFYGFSNADILFNSGLISSLKTVKNFREHIPECMVIVGKRSNYPVEQNETFFTKEDINSRCNQTRLYNSDALDFFFLAGNLYPWAYLPDVVIGRPAYDNFFVGLGRLLGVQAVDVSHTVIALHQTGTDGNLAGSYNIDADYNKDLIEKHYPGFNYYLGITTDTKYFTSIHPPRIRTVKLIKRAWKTGSLDQFDKDLRKNYTVLLQQTALKNYLENALKNSLTMKNVSLPTNKTSPIPLNKQCVVILEEL